MTPDPEPGPEPGIEGRIGHGRRFVWLAWLPWRRLLQAPLVLLVLITISFFMTRLAPGGPFASETRMKMPEETRAALDARYGFDQPLGVQFLRYLGGLVRGDLGPSTRYRDRSVQEIIAEHLPTSLLLGGISLLLAIAIGVGVGTLAAMRRNGLLDHGTMTLVMLGVSIPNFVIAPLLQILFGIWFEVLPIAGYQGWSAPLFLILPAVTLAAPFAARIAGLTRAGMLEVLGEDFVRTARAKGLAERTVIARHVLRGGLLPVMAYLGPAVAAILTGSLVVEKIFGIPGLGDLFVSSATNRDYFLVMGTVILYGALIIACNMVADLGQLILDPRQRSGR